MILGVDIFMCSFLGIGCCKDFSFFLGSLFSEDLLDLVCLRVFLLVIVFV